MTDPQALRETQNLRFPQKNNNLQRAQKILIWIAVIISIISIITAGILGLLWAKNIQTNTTPTKTITQTVDTKIFRE